MNDTQAVDRIYIFAYCLGGVGFAVGPFVAVYFLSARWTRAYADKTDQMVGVGMEPNGVDTPEQFRQFIRDDIDRWNRLIDVTGVKRGKP